MKTLQRINSVTDSRKCYRSLQRSKGEFKPRVTICRKNNGDIATSKDEVVTRWKEYFQEVLSGDIGEEVADYPR
jgi:2'-5' RNA ligase